MLTSKISDLAPGADRLNHENPYAAKYEAKMNLRSVFTVEQQRILQRYYEHGMTNQSKNCFQLILQCAQETQLDFSVVRTWVGNKRRKMSSKPAESGATPPGPAAGTPPTPPDRNAARPPGPQPPWTPPDGDVVVTGIYGPAGSSGRAKATEIHKLPVQRTPGKADPELGAPLPGSRQAAHGKGASLLLGEKAIILSRQSGVPNAANPGYGHHAKKSYGAPPGPDVAPQKPGGGGHRPGKAEPAGGPRPPKPEYASLAAHGPCAAPNLEIREVFSLAGTDCPPRIPGGSAAQRPGSREGSCLSIAMETGDVDDEYAREEELASMGAQLQSYSRLCEGGGPRVEHQSPQRPPGPGRGTGCASLLGNARDLPDGALYPQRDFHLPPRTSLHSGPGTMYSGSHAARPGFSPHFAPSNQLRLTPNQNNYQISGNLTVPWITGCSRKRALQDRTQFSDRDLATLKKYWDNGMTSLGSVCREKIEAVAAELNVDCEIVRTWIGNRRRKYRLMGIEVPPPRGGPADFSEQPEPGPKPAVTPGEEVGPDHGEDNDRNDEVSICLSEGSSQEEANDAIAHEEGRHKGEGHPEATSDNVKIEIIDDEESDMISNSEVEQMNSLLDYKNEEVRFIENELENQKQKYFELQTFARSLILAVKSDDKEQQQALLSDLPPELEEMDFSQASPEAGDTSFSLSSPSEK
ncbi:LOW QUALITY PROTEIN: highly divergent homeobox [Tachyglossus aculeatus]|uniref:LOW QUALITY PROTEIN: highly divergent homeobox n=1 Tax=Tachyglossus aculeatus TaxID=9261 RepID=UPI0018F7CACA|nr:LOW QUALITY PROTEIN: highly divergent homeobox [Tachyglossus aculeatus]